jgi:hypothetical protein
MYISFKIYTERYWSSSITDESGATEKKQSGKKIDSLIDSFNINKSKKMSIPQPPDGIYLNLLNYSFDILIII